MVRNLVIGLALGLHVANAATLRVDHLATGADTGSSWIDAFTSLEAALNASNPGDQIWITEGTYRPHPTDPTASFVISYPVEIYGGFPTGGGDGTFSARNPNPLTNVTVLYGDLLGDDDLGEGHQNDNSHNVVVVNILQRPPLGGPGIGPLLDGLTVTGGHGSEALVDGGGILCQRWSSVFLERMRFIANSGRSGGAIAVGEGELHVSNCTFVDNSARFGGAVAKTRSGNASIDHCYFQENHAESQGGALHLVDTALTVTASQFSGNHTPGDGGAVFTTVALELRLRSSVLVGNAAGQEGGAIFCQFSAPSIRTSTFVANIAGVAGGAIGSGSNLSPPRTRNSIFLNNVAQGDPSRNHSDFPFIATSTHNILSGGTTLHESFDSDPRFIRLPDPGDGDWTTPDDNDYGNLHLQPDSPAMNSGVNQEVRTDLDADHHPRIVNRIVDRGAFEHQGPITFARLFPELDPGADANGNGRTNFYDYGVGADPTAPHQGSLYPRHLPGARFSSTIRRISSDVVPLYQRSPDLVNWELMVEGEDHEVIETVLHSPNQESVTIQFLDGGPVEFVRQVFDLPGG